jgi:two-component system NarL family response regulator
MFAPARVAQYSAHPPAGSMTVPEYARIRILIADDHPMVRAGIVAMLANEPGFDVVAEARDGAEAVELFRAQQPDIVLMDLQMPQMGGVAAIRAIRADAPNARVIALTTFDGDGDVDRALSAGASASLLKDALIDQLVAAIRSVASATHRAG